MNLFISKPKIKYLSKFNIYINSNANNLKPTLILPVAFFIQQSNRNYTATEILFHIKRTVIFFRYYYDRLMKASLTACAALGLWLGNIRSRDIKWNQRGNTNCVKQQARVLLETKIYANDIAELREGYQMANEKDLEGPARGNLNMQAVLSMRSSGYYS